MSRVLVGDIVAAVSDAFPVEWAEPWDAVGLRVGDPAAPVSGVLVTLDATENAVATALDSGANVVITHHPPSLDEHAAFTACGASSILFRAAAAGVAIVSAHTNLDRAPDGAPVLLRSLNLPDGDPLESSALESVLLTVYVPATDSAGVRNAMREAGAGRIGEYEECSFTGVGQATYRPRAGAPGPRDESGGRVVAAEERVEMIAPKGLESAIVAAARACHPYEEPLITQAVVSVSRGVARLGRVTDMPSARSLEALVHDVASTFGCAPRVWGDADLEVARLATATGSGGSLVGAAVSAGADALLLGEVRYHDGLDALSQGIALIEMGHDVSEWPLVPVLAAAVRETPGLDPALIDIDRPSQAWWTP